MFFNLGLDVDDMSMKMLINGTVTEMKKVLDILVLGWSNTNLLHSTSTH